MTTYVFSSATVNDSFHSSPKLERPRHKSTSHRNHTEWEAEISQLVEAAERRRQHTDMSVNMCLATTWALQYSTANQHPLQKWYKKRLRVPILVTERWARSRSRCTGSQPAGDWSHPPGNRLPLLSAKPAVTFPAAEHHRPLAGTHFKMLPLQVFNGINGWMQT